MPALSDSAPSRISASRRPTPNDPTVAPFSSIPAPAQARPLADSLKASWLTSMVPPSEFGPLSKDPRPRTTTSRSAPVMGTSEGSVR